MADKCRSYKIKVFETTVEKMNEPKKKFDAIYPKLSKKYNLPLIPFLLEGVALNPSLNQQDGIHPNKDGTIKVSETIKKSIINIIN